MTTWTSPTKNTATWTSGTIKNSATWSETTLTPKTWYFKIDDTYLFNIDDNYNLEITNTEPSVWGFVTKS
jgi:hypothetical protein